MSEMSVDLIEDLQRECANLRHTCAIHQREIEIAYSRLAMSNVQNDHLMKSLSRVYNCVMPPDVKDANGQIFRFHHPNPHEYLQLLSNAIRGVEEELSLQHPPHDTSRTVFEAWALHNGYSISRNLDDSDYAETETQCVYQLWLSARSFA